MWEPTTGALERLATLSMDEDGAFAAARRLIGHPDNDVRWQGLIAGLSLPRRRAPPQFGLR